MKNVAIFCAVLLGCAAVAGATVIPCNVTTASQQDNLVLGFEEVLTTDVGTVPGGGQVNEIDIRETLISGTYGGEFAGTIYSNSAIVTYAGTFYVDGTGAVAYLYGSGTNGASPSQGTSSNTGDGLFGNVDDPGYWSPGLAQRMTIFGLDTALPSPTFAAFAASGTPFGGTSHIFQATRVTAANYTNNNYFDQLYAPRTTRAAAASTTSCWRRSTSTRPAPASRSTRMTATRGTSHTAPANMAGWDSATVAGVPATSRSCRNRHPSRPRWPCWAPRWSGCWCSPGRSEGRRRKATSPIVADMRAIPCGWLVFVGRAAPAISSPPRPFPDPAALAAVVVKQLTRAPGATPTAPRSPRW